MILKRAGSVMLLYLIGFVCLSTQLAVQSFGDDDIDDFPSHEVTTPKGPMPKDKILLRDVKSLHFQRNKRTTSRRTHSIYQLSCVGGTAGCKLFTSDNVECFNKGYEEATNKIDWQCRAEMSDRVKFNHVEIICEGYDYAEDDHILLGSCGLEFTLDYVDPLDHHDKSYYKHMDEHEKELHRKRTLSTATPTAATSNTKPTVGYWHLVKQMIVRLTEASQSYALIALFVLLVLAVILVRILVARILTTESAPSSGRPGSKRVKSPGYGPLTSAVLTTKKAC